MKLTPVEIVWNQFLAQFRDDLINSYKKEELIAADKLVKTFAAVCRNSNLYFTEIEIVENDEVKQKVEEVQDKTQKQENKQEQKTESEEIVEETKTEEIEDEDLKEILGE